MLAGLNQYSYLRIDIGATTQLRARGRLFVGQRR
jgi:hypothetical protein